MKKTVKIVMLPTEDKAIVFTSKRDSKLHYHFKGNTPNNIKSYQHLYFTSDEEIKKGDWCICDKKLFKYKGKSKWQSTKKIIATTDKKLTIQQFKEPTGLDIFNAIAQIPQSFIEEYVKQGGIDEVELDMVKI